MTSTTCLFSPTIWIRYLRIGTTSESSAVPRGESHSLTHSGTVLLSVTFLRFVHAVEAAKEAIEAAPITNRKLLILLTDGVADDWNDALKIMIKMQQQHQTAPGATVDFLVLGVAACSYYEDEFPVQSTLKLMGEQYQQQLFMLSRDNERPREVESVTLQPG